MGTSGGGRGTGLLGKDARERARQADRVREIE